MRAKLVMQEDVIMMFSLSTEMIEIGTLTYHKEAFLTRIPFMRHSRRGGLQHQMEVF